MEKLCTSVYLECASNSVPTVNTIKKLIRYLAAMKYDALYLGTADTYEIEGEPYFGYNRGQFKLKELQMLDEFARQNDIKIIPGLQTLAHLDFLPQYNDYTDIFDIENILLVDNEKTYRLIDKMFASARKAYTSDVIHIGMDEAFLLGLGKYMKEHGYTDRTEIMLRHLNCVLEIAKKYGFTCEMWSDMFFRLVNNGEYDLNDCKMHCELQNKIPKNLKLIYWNYGNVGYERLANAVSQHKKITDSLGFAGGIMKWMGFAPDNEYSINALPTALKVCKEYGVNDFMVTLWADNGGEASWFSVLPGLYFYSQYFQGKTTSLKDLNKNEFASMTGIDFDDFMLVDKVNKPHKDRFYIAMNNKCLFYLYNDVFLGNVDSLISDGIDEEFLRVSEEIQNVNGGEFQYIFDSLAALAKVLSIKAELGKKLKKAYQEDNKEALKTIDEVEITKLLEYLNDFFEKFSIAWRKENKAYGFEGQCIKLGGLRQRLEYVRKVVREYINGTINKIEQLESEKLPFNYTNWSDNLSEDDLVLSKYSRIALNSVL